MAMGTLSPEALIAAAGERDSDGKRRHTERAKGRGRSGGRAIDKCGGGGGGRGKGGTEAEKRPRRTGRELYPNVPITRFRSRISEFICTYTQARRFAKQNGRHTRMRTARSLGKGDNIGREPSHVIDSG